MARYCKKCGDEVDWGLPYQNGMCIGCFSGELGEVVEPYPICAPLHLAIMAYQRPIPKEC